MAKCKARLAIEAGNARLVERAIAADNPGYVKASAEEGRVVVLIESESIGSMLATLDDLLVNLKIADEILGDRGAIEGQED